MARILLITIGLIAVVLVGAYTYFTRPAFLQARLQATLAAFPEVRVSAGDVRFALSGALELRDLLVTPAGGNAAAGPDAPRLRIDHARIELDRGRLLCGELKPTHVALRDVQAVLRRRSFATRGAGAGEPVVVELAPTSVAEVMRDFPTLDVEQLELQVRGPAAADPRLLRRWDLNGIGRPTDGGYVLRFVRARAASETLLQVDWQKLERRLHLSTGWLGLRAIAALLPAEATALLRSVDLQGEARAVDLLIDLGAAEKMTVGDLVRAGVLEVRGLAGALPIEVDPESGEPLPPSQRFAHIRDAHGRVELRTGAARLRELDARGTAELNGEPAEYAVALALPADMSALHWADILKSAELRVQRFTLPTDAAQPLFVRSPRLPRGIRNFFEHLKPSGTLNVRLAVQAAAPGAATALGFAGEIEALSVRCRHGAFPYWFEDARGRVRFSPDGIFYEDIYARHGSARIRFSGWQESPFRATGFELNFVAEDVPLNEDVYAALPADYRHIWEASRPLGLTDAVVRISRPHSPPDIAVIPPTRVQVQARQFGSSMAIGAGARIRNMIGTFALEGDALEIDALHGHVDEALVTLHGRMDIGQAMTRSELSVTAADARVEQSFEIPGATQAARLVFAGIADAWGTLAGRLAGDEPDGAWTVAIKDGSLTGFGQPARWRNCAGLVTLEDDRREIHRFTATRGDARLMIEGKVPSGDAAGDRQPLRLSVSEAAMATLSDEFVPPQWRDTVAKLGLGGAGWVDVELRDAPDSAGLRVQIGLHADQARPEVVPVPLRDVSGDATVEGEYVRVQGARARYGEGAIDLDGWLSWSADAPAAKFQLRGQDVALDEELVAALPEMLAGVLRPLTPRGRMRFTLSPVMRGAGTEREWRVTGELSLSAATLDVGLKLTELEATLDGAASVLAGGRAVMDAAFVIDSARLAGRPLRDVAGRLLSDPANPWLRLNDLHGQLCGGDFLGFVRIDPRTQDYELSLTLRGVEFGQLMPPKDETAPPRSGLVEGRVYLRGTAGAPESRQGGGRLRLSGASLLQTPVVADVARERQQQTDELRDLLNVADVEFIWIGDMLTFERVTIDSPDLRLVGTGAWNMATNALRLTLVGSHPRDWPRIPLLTALAETAGQELIQYQVRGTTAAPRVSAEPLYKLNAALRALLLGEAE